MCFECTSLQADVQGTVLYIIGGFALPSDRLSTEIVEPLVLQDVLVHPRTPQRLLCLRPPVYLKIRFEVL